MYQTILLICIKRNHHFFGCFYAFVATKIRHKPDYCFYLYHNKKKLNKNPIPSLEFRVLFDSSSSKLYKKDPSQKNA